MRAFAFERVEVERQGRGEGFALSSPQLRDTALVQIDAADELNIVVALPEGAAPALYGPVDSCREFTLQVQPEALVFSTEPLPSEPGEVWVWNPATGLTEAAPEAFSADAAAGWEAVPSLLWAISCATRFFSAAFTTATRVFPPTVSVMLLERSTTTTTSRV